MVNEAWNAANLDAEKMESWARDVIIDEETITPLWPEDLKPKRGRPKVSDDRQYGSAIVALLHNFILMHGQPTDDPHRLRTTFQVVGSSLSDLQAYAAENGFPISKSAIYNLLQPKHPRDRHSSCRSEIPARIAHLVASEKRFHSHVAFSTSLLKYGRQFVVMVNATAGRGMTLDLDDMAKVPLVIPARMGCKRVGFQIANKDGKIE